VKPATVPPRTLTARLALLVVVVGLLSLLLHFSVLWLLMHSLSGDLSAHLSSRVLAQRALLLATPAAQRPELARRWQSERYRVAPLTADAPSTQPPPWPARNIVQDLREHVGPDMRVSFMARQDGAPARLRFVFDVEGVTWAAEVVPAPPVLALTGTLVGWPVLIAAGVIAALMIGVRVIGRPLAQTSAAIAAQGEVLRPIDVPAHASGEVVSLVHAFNQLAAELRTADQTKQQLLAGVSHDLRTPLARLRLRIETQCEGAVEQALQADLLAVERIVSQFLAYVQADRHAASAGLGRLAPMVDTVRQVAAESAEQGEAIEMQLEAVQGELPDLALRRALANLIDNARAHGRTPIQVSLRDTAQGPRLTVWDHGPGIAPSDFAQALRPFVRLQAQDTGRQALGHCGLGLAIVAQMAQHLHADLSCERDAQARFGVSLQFSRPLTPRPPT
jgi:two-component system, OmpR family, osmolarity sensor histidine kinase EnvZ